MTEIKTSSPAPVCIFGHRNPDTDSICSAIAYAYLKHAEGHIQVSPKRLGPLNKETAFVLNYFHLETPELIANVRPRVSDLPLDYRESIFESDSVRYAMQKIINAPGRALPVTDRDYKLTGILSLPDIMNAYTQTFHPALLKAHAPLWKNICIQLKAKVIGRALPETVTGNVMINTEMEDKESCAQEDTVVTALNDPNMLRAFRCGAGNIILANVQDSMIPDAAADFDGTVLLCDIPPYEVIHRLTQTIPVSRFVQKQNLEYFLTYESIDDVRKNMLTSAHHHFPVVDEEGHLIAMISRSSLYEYRKKPVILVDHNERSQSIEGIEEAEILEVIDHHRIAEIQTAAPLFLRMEPVGCTCTIIAKMFFEKKIPIPKPIAGIMLSAILSDTLIFNSPTCTNTDREIAEKLADIAEINIECYGREMLIAGSNLADMTPMEILSADRKRFSFGRYKVVISQINTGDYNAIVARLEDLTAQMAKDCSEQGFDLAVLMITDVLLGGSELLFAGAAHQLAEIAFGIAPNAISRFIPGIYSRKKQIVPPLMNAAAMM